ncbi:unnamed protein product [Merluccius merluccius]
MGFRRGMNDLLDTGLDVEVMATDRSTSIQKITREEFPHVQHEFDIWHTAKGFRKKLLIKGKKKGNEILLSWNSKGDIEYLPKRQAFSYEGMRERAYLAIMDHNENIVAREQATMATAAKGSCNVIIQEPLLRCQLYNNPFLNNILQY